MVAICRLDSTNCVFLVIFCSAKLRSALHLSPTDYPPYIRRMLIHGYPPGYRLLEQENHLSLIDGKFHIVPR